MKSLRFVLASCILVAVSNALVMPAHARIRIQGQTLHGPIRLALAIWGFILTTTLAIPG